jgi:serine/threonine protein kinase
MNVPKPALKRASKQAHPDEITNNSAEILKTIEELKVRLNNQTEEVGIKNENENKKKKNIFPEIKIFKKNVVTKFCDDFNTNIKINGKLKNCEEIKSGSQFIAYKIDDIDKKNWVYKKSKSSKRNPQNLEKHYLQEYLNGESWKTLSDLTMEEFKDSIQKICKELLRVYEFFYRKGIKHNDFHLSNILFNTTEGRMKIIDYDLMSFHDTNNDSFNINKYLDWYKSSHLPKHGTPDTIYIRESDLDSRTQYFINIMGINEDKNLKNRPGMNPTLMKKYVMIRNRLKTMITINNK